MNACIASIRCVFVVEIARSESPLRNSKFYTMDDSDDLSLDQALQHGDLSLRFADGRCLRVHSTILFLASSVLRRLFQDLGSSEGIAAKRPRTEHGATSRGGGEEDSVPVRAAV